MKDKNRFLWNIATSVVKGFNMKNLTSEEKKTILKARAKAIAMEPEKDDTGEACLDVVDFSLAHEIYAIESLYIREVCLLKDLTLLPGLPPFVLGIINVHGQVVSVLDIKKFFDLPEKGITNLNRVIIIQKGGSAMDRIGGMEFGILADAIIGVRSIPLKDIVPSLPTLTGIRKEYLRGVTKDSVVILDADKLLSDETIVINEEGN